MSEPKGQPLQLGPWPAGVNNIAVETRLSALSVRAGINVDLTNEGVPRRRQGHALVLSVAGGAHSLWSDGANAYFASGDTLYQLTDYGSRTLFSGLVPDVPLSYVVMEPFVRVSDGFNAWKLTPYGDAEPWGVPTPLGQPVLTASAAGGLLAGRYMVAVTYQTPSGEESGSPEPAVIDLAADGGIQLSGFVTPPSVVSKIRVYMTKHNGTELLFVGSSPPNVTTINLGNGQLGRQLQTLLLEPLPAGTSAAYFNGRLFVAVGSLLFWSQSLMYGLHNPQIDFVQMRHPITLLASMPEGGRGLFVCSEYTSYFFAGESPYDARLVQAYPNGAIAGSLTYVPASLLPEIEGVTYALPVWLSTNGVFCAGLPDGTIIPLTEKQYAAARGTRAGSLFRKQRGMTQVVTTMQGPVAQNPLAISDSVAMTVTRNGIQI